KHIIEPLRCGRSLIKMGQENLKEPYNGDNWACYRGEGPTDLIVEFANGGGIERLIMTFRHEARYYEVKYKGGKITTGQADISADIGGLGGVSALMKQTAKIDQDIVKYCAGVVIGFEQDVRDTIPEFVSSIF